MADARAPVDPAKGRRDQKLPIIDPISGVQTNKLFMWNGKIWWAASQDVPLTFIQHQEINSVLNAWGTNGSSRTAEAGVH